MVNSQNLAKTQQFLARLYTNRQLREDFFTNPPDVARKWGIEEGSIQQLSTLDRAQVEFFASSLISKRLNQVSKFLPLTQKALGRDFSRLFVDYAETYSPSGIKKHWQDALAFCDFLQQTPFEKDWWYDVVRYERENLRRLDSKLQFCCYRSRYAIQPLIESLQKSSETPVLIQKPTWVVEFKIGEFSSNFRKNMV
ncbi:hypothetical protein [Oscillatoria sp. FACHB-1406]|uniref:hypothetical protein n=1 Tax=Oscillatoria sp. FACHB-1406 TaxID=2692846 RepID=UPI0016899421|nr:hypothetical protein [Oscillatoria sp. FACHB-1406]MBD2576213.1 hypothetical protein [Oscillatoria sp. FACHB-1406]